jgi:hypothetical protein
MDSMPALCHLGRFALRAFPIFTCGLVAGAILCRWNRRQSSEQERLSRTIWQPGMN